MSLPRAAVTLEHGTNISNRSCLFGVTYSVRTTDTGYRIIVSPKYPTCTKNWEIGEFCSFYITQNGLHVEFCPCGKIREAVFESMNIRGEYEGQEGLDEDNEEKIFVNDGTFVFSGKLLRESLLMIVESAEEAETTAAGGTGL